MPPEVVAGAVGTPGGLFAPLLAVGAIGGALVAALADAVGLAADPAPLAVTGMVAFFAGVVRAPLAGVVLLLEMTGAVTLLLPALVAVAVATAAADAVVGEPVYDSLRARLRTGGPGPVRPG